MQLQPDSGREAKTSIAADCVRRPLIASVANFPMNIRELQTGDEAGLHAVFLSAIHNLASKDYTPEQIEAWASATLDPEVWAKRMQGIRPFVVESNGRLIAYADVQPSGYIDHFFVSGPFARTGIGTMLMNRIHATASARGIKVLTSDVSRTAQPFFARFGFVVVEQKASVIRGVAVANALMRCRVTAQHWASLQSTTKALRNLP